MNITNNLPEILFITSYPKRECGIATYSEDIISALNKKFGSSFSISVCALENGVEQYEYPEEVKYTLNTSLPKGYIVMANKINMDNRISLVMIQHEFGFYAGHEDDFLQFLYRLNKPICLTFHTVLPKPDALLGMKVKRIAAVCQSVIVMTNNASEILEQDYDVPAYKIEVIQHGTHLVPHLNKEMLKSKYGLSGRKVLSTFGLLSSGKRIETTLDAIPAIISLNPSVVFLIIGKTHPTVFKNEGEIYREKLEAKVNELELQNNVKFINYYLPLTDLLEYLQLTDIYLFTSSDPHQAVSGTFSYAMSCGCPIISTPIPHAKEMLNNGAGMLIDFDNSQQLGYTVNRLLGNEELMKNMSNNALHKIASTAWENAATAHALLFEKLSDKKMSLKYTMPTLNLDHVKNMTTDFGIIQFSNINQPDISSGYTLDDNARAMIAFCQHFEITSDQTDLKYIKIYLAFIKHCLLTEGYFLNYVDEQKNFTEQNKTANLADSNGRAIWALGYLISLGDKLPEEFINDAEAIMQNALRKVSNIHSTRAMAFIIKGLYYRNTKNKSVQNLTLITGFANRLVQMYRHESDKDWQWFESYLTYANGILPEAMLCAWLTTAETVYKEIAISSFDFLLMKTLSKDRIKVISNKNWLHKGEEYLQQAIGGEQPIDVAYTVLALGKFYEVFRDEDYLNRMGTAFNWFLGNNHLHQVIYNPCTGGSYDGLEENYVNLNQGAESTISYLMARLTFEKSSGKQKVITVSGEKVGINKEPYLQYPAYLQEQTMRKGTNSRYIK